MEIKLPPYYVPYGPVGHPEARAFVRDLSFDKEELWGEFYRYLERYSRQNVGPSTFFNDSLTLEQNGYFILEVVDGQIPDDVIAALPVPFIYAPAKPGTPGRKLADLKGHLPSYFKPHTAEVWEKGADDCNHDFGLESYQVLFKELGTDETFRSEDITGENFHRVGTYYGVLKCTRCGEVHALPEPS